MATTLKELDLSKPNFMANGREYFIEPELSVDFLHKMYEFEIELGLGVGYDALNKHLDTAFNYMNTNRLADASVEIHNLRQGITKMMNREATVFKYCSCFIHREGDDRKVFDEKIMLEKIEDWKAEGFNYMSFFRLAVSMGNGLKESYNNSIQDTSVQKKA